MRLKDRRVVLGVTGSIAAYKALEVLRRLKKEGADVWVVMTRNAQKFITPISFQTLSSHPVATGSFVPSPDPLPHINLATGCDLILVVPATANILSKAASGIGDDLLSTILIATTKPVVFAPAMHETMWQNPIIKQNVTRLKERGYRFIEPETGELASGTLGTGRLAPVETIVQVIAGILTASKSWAGRSVIVTAGRTEEPIDPIRVITNRSSGRMGFELARLLKDRGAKVKLIAGKTSVEPPPGIEIERVTTSDEMLTAVEKNLQKTVLVLMAAAVSDFRPEFQSPTKAKGKELPLILKRTEDILARISKNKDKKIIVGFSLETEDGIARAKNKLTTKNLDMIVANPVESLESDTSQATLIFRNGTVKELPLLLKSALAEIIIDEIEKLLIPNG